MPQPSDLGGVTAELAALIDPACFGQRDAFEPSSCRSRRRSSLALDMPKPRWTSVVDARLLRRFETIEELRKTLLVFRDTYNTTWLIERHGYFTPEQFRQKLVPVPAKVA